MPKLIVTDDNLEAVRLARDLLAYGEPMADRTGDDQARALPAWYPQLRELLVRHLRRPAVVNDELRYAEWAAEAQLGKERATAAEAFGPFFSPVAAKLLSDVCGFLVTVAGLNPDFRAFARTVFAQPDPVTDSARSARGEQPESESPISAEDE